MFYSRDEFEFQVDELFSQGYSITEAAKMVTRQMHKDEQEYLAYWDKMDALDDRRPEPEPEDAYYEQMVDRWEHDQAIYNEFG